MPIYGITHDSNTGKAIIQVPKVLKVSIGLLKGPDIRVKIAPDGKWHVIIGDGKTKAVETGKFDSKDDARVFYEAKKGNAPTRSFPAKLNYFTFARKLPDGNYEPDFDAIEAHGPMPTTLSIVFVQNDPFDARMEYWAATELRCSGDGHDALRSVAFTAGYEADAAEWAAKKARFFPILQGCSEFGCPYCERDGDKKGPCGPKGKLLFQLSHNPMIGGTSFLHTTGVHSIKDINSCLETIKGLTSGRLIGIPLMLVLKQGTGKVGSKKTTFYTVHVEYRGPAAGAEIIHQLMESSAAFGPAVPELPAGSSATRPETVIDERFGTEAEQGDLHNSEFEAELERDDEGEEGGELEEEPVLTDVKPPPPVAAVRESISKSGQQQKSTKKRSDRVFALAKSVGVQNEAIIGLIEKESGVSLTSGKSLTPADNAAVEKAFDYLEMLSKEDLAAKITK